MSLNDVGSVSGTMEEALLMNRRPPRLLSIQVGRPRTIGIEGAKDPMDRAWTTGFFKEPVVGTIRLGRLNLDGDGQADLKNHGGPDKAACLYSADHYPDWRIDLERSDLPYGAFGENLTINDLTEPDVCLGDIYALGDARVQVSQPRQPCWKLARRWRITDLPARVVRNGRTGWYVRVLDEGTLEAGQEFRLLDRPNPDWSIERANRVMHHLKNDPRTAEALADVDALAENWKVSLRKRAAKLDSRLGTS